jgi:hypothetical protein
MLQTFEDEAPPGRLAKHQRPLEWDGVPDGRSSPSASRVTRRLMQVEGCRLLEAVS